MTRPRPYNYRWQQASAGYLRKHPLCAMCEQIDHATPATVVDHITPHRGDMQLFWDRENWQGLCKPCHDRHKSRQERGGRLAGCDVNGNPLDQSHHWNEAKAGR